MTASTRLEQVREQISALADDGLDSVDIAARLGLTVGRVDQVLDQLEGTRVAALPKPTLPMRNPAGPPAPKLASVPSPPEPKTRAAHGADVCGTPSGYQRHLYRKETACEPCKTARNAYQRELRLRKAAAPKGQAAAPQAKPQVQVHWLIPRGASIDGAHLEYAVVVAGRTVPCDFPTAELAAAHDETVLSRWATDWHKAN